jgi:hypothetical protein
MKNMKSSLLPNALRFAARFVQIQLFLTVFSLPILIAWGLPFSLLSPLGNLIFGPVLTLFLLFSSLIFFLQLLCMPYAWLVQGLELITHYWLTIMHSDPKTWLIGFAAPPAWCLLTISLASLLVLLCVATNAIMRSIACWASLLALLWLYTYYAQHTVPQIASFPCNRGAVTIIYHDRAITVIDPGYIGQRLSAPSWVQYTLMPHLIRTYGTCAITHIITLRNNTMTLEALERLCTTAGGLTTIYMPPMPTDMTPATTRTYKHLRTTAYHKKVALRFLHDDAFPISISNTKNMTLHPVATTETGNATHEIPGVCLQIDNENITIYAARYAKKNKPSSDNTFSCTKRVVRAVNDHEKGSFGHSISGVSAG